jgi:hypothetical protein
MESRLQGHGIRTAAEQLMGGVPHLHVVHAWRVVREAGYGQSRRIEVSPLQERRETRGLEYSAFVQAAGWLDDDIEVLVTADGESPCRRSPPGRPAPGAGCGGVG